jgi:hypothetical protein
MNSDAMVFGEVIQPLPKVKKENQIGSPRVSIGADRSMPGIVGEMDKSLPTGMGVKDEAMGLIEGGQGLKALGENE